ncbi:single-stranded DNA-binding protein [Pelagicoccus sp. NFK12]|uniref:Single-stranded DNA-binding protein n=1 Tax=Pelagicoccus enzymogenes TaxID=2773457 RepID=A0A927F535_9BACT|nr:single-stranded DNA-binding protein [Pelagicoccus enzymogenes]MBD5778210.1 single-stranded DNA-binding protein [Pelagicoccus enzymogenes]MDQ8201143.1 single-stranded DNA-binding protein [Pelagicoccus enzymogenes]
MANFNKVILLGNLTRDPELRVTPKGTSVCQFGMAVNRVYRSGDETQEETTFVDLEAWGKQAEIISKYVSKGNPLFIEGRLKFDSWESKEGEKRSKLKVIVENMQLMGSRGDNNGGGQGSSNYAPAQRESGSSASSSQAPASSGDIEEDVPF